MLTQRKLAEQLAIQLYWHRMDAAHLEDSPARAVFLTAEWRHLAMLNYEVDRKLLAPFVPAGTALDCWKGKFFVSLVGFRFLETRVFGIPFPFHRNFDEVNLRFYVRRDDRNGVKRGVVFIREIVPRWLIAAVARGFYSERYVALPMSHDIGIDEHTAQVGYGWKFNGNWNKLTLKADASPVLPEEGSEKEFITEHYWGYAAQPHGRCMEYQVEHPRWRVWTAREARFEGCVDKLYGREFAAMLNGLPASAFLAEGSAVSVYRGRRLQDVRH
jgi:uncharacterized protein